MKQPSQLQRRTETFEGFDFTFFSVDAINPGQEFLLNEPLELSAELVGSPLAVARVSVEISAMDQTLAMFPLELRCILAHSIPEAEAANKLLLWTKVVARRQREGFFQYLHRSIESKRATVTILIPELRSASNLAGAHGWLSDPLHDSVKTISYNTAPWQYLFGPLRKKLR